MTRLSVLDQSPVRHGGTPADAIRETLELERLTDALGYHRYWLAEHHASDGLAGSIPEVLIARVAAETQRIRVGSGGVMLTHYSPLKVAEAFRMLETLSPGRIDLGLGREPGSDQRTAQALAYVGGMTGAEYFPRQVQDVIGWLSGTLEADHPFADVKAQPSGDTMPEIWLLGSSDQSAQVAAHFGTAFSFAHFITDQGGTDVMEMYRRRFQPSEHLANPHGSIGVFVICADTEEEAKRLSSSRDLWRLRLDRGEIGPIPTVDEAQAYTYSDLERSRVAQHRRRNIVGTPEQVRQKLDALLEQYGVEEAAIISITHDFGARKRTLRVAGASLRTASVSRCGRIVRNHLKSSAVRPPVRRAPRLVHVRVQRNGSGAGDDVGRLVRLHFRRRSPAHPEQGEQAEQSHKNRKVQKKT